MGLFGRISGMMRKVFRISFIQCQIVKELPHMHIREGPLISVYLRMKLTPSKAMGKSQREKKEGPVVPFIFELR